MNNETHIIKNVQEYYGKVLESNEDLKTSACCLADALPAHLQPLLNNIHKEVKDKFYGCGSPLPLALEGKTILDLGCGTGRDCYLFSQLVGPKGRVIGVDMTDEQLAVANRHVDFHMEKFGYPEPNVEFRKGFIEDLGAAKIADASVDVVVSNCVFNLSANKQKLFNEVLRVLKPGGELYFSDVFSGRRIPDHLRNDPVMIGECLGGALYIEDFRRILRTAGILDYRVVSNTPMTLDDPEISQKAGMIDFCSMTVRAFKCEFEDICENFGHAAYYLGTVAESPHAFVLDDHHTFPTGLPVAVCGNTAKMLSETRFGEHFRVVGDFSTHYGPFDCAPADASANAASNGDSGACC